jgi:hypothetical protein
MRIRGSFWFCLLILIPYLLLWQSNLVLGCSDGNCPGQAQINWLISMQNPNTGLVDSYEKNNNNFAYIIDQALAIIAFTEANEPNRARMILNKMNKMQLDDPNGPWNEWYRVDDPNNIDWGSQRYVTGPIAWMVMAINFYECRTKDPNYANMAHRALRWLDTMRNTNPNNDRYGSLRWCDGPRCTADNANNISTEHNFDAYSAYYWRGMLDSNDSYLYKASLILDYLRKEMWAPSPNSNCDQYSTCNHNVKIFWEGYGSFLLATDCQSWGVLSLGAFGPDGEEFYKSLDWLLDNPYGTTRTTHDYNNTIQDVNGFRSFVGIREICDPNLWGEYSDDPNHVWVDGTEHVAAAFYSIGDINRGDRFHNQMRRIIDVNGGLVHSFREDEPNNITWERRNYRYNYVGSVAWYYFNEVRLNPFNLRPCSAECRAANIDGIGRVNFLDYAIFALDWLETGPDLAGDINGDRRVQNMDLYILIDYWLNDCQ